MRSNAVFLESHFAVLKFDLRNEDLSHAELEQIRVREPVFANQVSHDQNHLPFQNLS